MIFNVQKQIGNLKDVSHLYINCTKWIMASCTVEFTNNVLIRCQFYGEERDTNNIFRKCD